jgi:hypothetical protein
MIKNKKGKCGVIIEEAHVCGRRCAGKGGLEADEIGCLGRWGGVDSGGDEFVVVEDGEHSDLEVGDG